MINVIVNIKKIGKIFYAFCFTLGIANCSTDTTNIRTCAVTVGTDVHQTFQENKVQFRLKKEEQFYCPIKSLKELRDVLPRFFNQAPSIDLSTTTQATFLTVLSEMKAEKELLRLLIKDLSKWLQENDPKVKAYMGYSSIPSEKKDFFSRAFEKIRFWRKKHSPTTQETFNLDKMFNQSSLDQVELSKADMILLHQIQFMHEALELEHAIANEGNVEEVLSNIYVQFNKRKHIRNQEWMIPWFKGLELKSSLRNSLFYYIHYNDPLNIVYRYCIYSVFTAAFICLPVFLIYQTYYYETSSNPFYNLKIEPSSQRFVSPLLASTVPVFKIAKAVLPLNRIAHVLGSDVDTVDMFETIKLVTSMILSNIVNFRITLTDGLDQFSYALNQENATLLQFQETTDRCIALDHIDEATSSITFPDSAIYACAFTTPKKGILTLMNCGELSSPPFIKTDCVHNSINWDNSQASLLAIRGKAQPLTFITRLDLIQWTADIPTGILSNRSYKWTEIQANGTVGAPPPRWGHATGRVGDKIFVGFGYDISYDYRDDVYTYNLTSNDWQQFPSSITMVNPGVCTNNNSIWILGVSSSSTNLTSFTETGQQFTIKFSNSIILASAIAMFNNSMYIFGGYSTRYRNTLYFANRENLSSFVNITPSFSPSARSSTEFNVVGDDAYMFGGTNTSHNFNDLWKLNLISQEWTQIIPIPDPVHGIPAYTFPISGVIENNIFFLDLAMCLKMVCGN